MTTDREDIDPVPTATAADAQEQRQDETEVGPADAVTDAVPEASEADLAEQGALPPPSAGAGLADAAGGDVTPADAQEQNLEIPTPDEDRRD
ncbi:hypothetical protein AB0873_15605 [Micromonospora sp. NPDC047707]|uniref:hypothetical protein n=1 Tax=unclassified Micromonospora TaxID=2617518 RepID=UPI0012B4633F|nr:hypothetical protein [Micromonospora sp. WMMC415]QGN48273.1 hypothetical protein GKC29_16455 [Micromonospora sp. WMMC415]